MMRQMLFLWILSGTIFATALDRENAQKIQSDLTVTANEIHEYLTEITDDSFFSPDSWGFVHPNETFPDVSADLVRHIMKTEPPSAGSKAGFSVGSERAWTTLGSLLHSGHLNRLLLVDADAKVYWYNQVNLALIAVAKDREDYMNLRLLAPITEWSQRFLDAGITLQDFELAACFAFWRGAMLPMREAVQILREVLWHGALSPYMLEPIKNLYTMDDAVFESLQISVQKNHVEVIKSSLGEEGTEFTRSLQNLKEKNILLTLGDFSNIFDVSQDYIDIFPFFPESIDWIITSSFLSSSKMEILRRNIQANNPSMITVVNSSRGKRIFSPFGGKFSDFFEKEVTVDSPKIESPDQAFRFMESFKLPDDNVDYGRLNLWKKVNSYFYENPQLITQRFEQAREAIKHYRELIEKQ